jgi:hypothetical protein
MLKFFLTVETENFMNLQIDSIFLNNIKEASANNKIIFCSY